MEGPESFGNPDEDPKFINAVLDVLEQKWDMKYGSDQELLVKESSVINTIGATKLQHRDKFTDVLPLDFVISKYRIVGDIRIKSSNWIDNRGLRVPYTKFDAIERLKSDCKIPIYKAFYVYLMPSGLIKYADLFDCISRGVVSLAHNNEEVSTEAYIPNDLRNWKELHHGQKFLNLVL